MHRLLYRLSCFMLLVLTCSAPAHDFTHIVKNNKPSVVGLGIYDPLGSPRATLQGSGFVIGDGSLVVTNYHVVDNEIDTSTLQKPVVFYASDSGVKTQPYTLLDIDPLHDLAILRIETKLPAMKLAAADILPDGKEIAFTGYPLAGILGFFAATHTGVIAAYSPVVRPSGNASQLSVEMMKRLRDPFYIYQLDATAYPGNSGSAVYELERGEVVAVINKVFVQETKESAITAPSGISYAIPVKYVHNLLKKVEDKSE